MLFWVVLCAQTVANFYLAFEQDLVLLPVLNKVDLPSADPAAATEQMVATFDINPTGVRPQGCRFVRFRADQGVKGSQRTRVSSRQV